MRSRVSGGWGARAALEVLDSRALLSADASGGGLQAGLEGPLSAGSAAHVRADVAATIDWGLTTVQVLGESHGGSVTGGPVLPGGTCLVAVPEDLLKFGGVLGTSTVGVRVTLEPLEPGLSVVTLPDEQLAGWGTVRLIAVPTGTSAGQYRVRITLDPDNLVDETDEANNTAISPDGGPYLSVAATGSLPDLAVQAPVIAGDQAFAGGRLLATVNLQAVGIGAPQRAKFELAGNEGGTPIDLGTEDLRPGGNRISLTIPRSAASGAYTLVVIVDPEGAIAESDESNNGARSDVLFVGDPTTSFNVAAPGESLAAGRSAVASLTILNHGDVAAGGKHAYSIYLQPVGSVDSRAALVGRARGRASAAVDIPVKLSLPRWMAAGNYDYLVRDATTGVLLTAGTEVVTARATNIAVKVRSASQLGGGVTLSVIVTNTGMTSIRQPLLLTVDGTLSSEGGGAAARLVRSVALRPGQSRVLKVRLAGPAFAAATTFNVRAAFSDRVVTESSLEDNVDTFHVAPA